MTLDELRNLIVHHEEQAASCERTAKAFEGEYPNPPAAQHMYHRALQHQQWAAQLSELAASFSSVTETASP